MISTPLSGRCASALSVPSPAPTQARREGGDDNTIALADSQAPVLSQVPLQCIPVHANVTLMDWSKLASACQFDVIMMDPPWQARTRGYGPHALHEGRTSPEDARARRLTL